MDLNVVSAKVLGSPLGGTWLQVHEYTPNEEKKLSTRGTIFAAFFASSSDENFDSIAFGREVLLRLHEEYFGDLTKEPFDALKGAVEKVFGEFSPRLSIFQIATSSFVDGVFYTAVSGGAKAVLLRGSMFAAILESSEVPISASGYPKEGDIFLIGTKEFFQEFNESYLRSTLAQDITLSEETLTASVYASEFGSKIAACVIKFTSGGEKGIENLDIVTNKGTSESFGISPKQKKRNPIFEILSKLPKRRIYIKPGLDEPVEKSKKTTLFAGIILIAILFVSIFFGVRQKLAKDKKSSYQGDLQTATHSLEEAKSLKDLSPDRARELFLQSEELAKKLSAQGVKDKDVELLISEINANKGEILSEYDANSSLFIDLSLLSNGFRVDTLASSSDYFAALDINGKRAAEVELSNKKAEIVSGVGDLEGNLKDIAIYTDEVYISTDTKIYKMNGSAEAVSDVSTPGTNFIYTYTGNIYLLNKGASKIERYQAISNGFGDAKDWLGQGQSFDFSGVTSWTIDGSIWLGYSQGRIQKLTQGVQDGLNVSGVTPSIEKVDSIYSNEELDGVYILEKDKARIVVIGKDGNFQAEYLGDGLKTAEHIIASEKLKKIYFSDDAGKVYSIDIKHLK